MFYFNKRVIFNFTLVLIFLVSLFLPFHVSKAATQATQTTQAIQTTQTIQTTQATQATPKIQVVYFHGNLCEMCDEDFKFKSMFYNKTNKDQAGVEIVFSINNIFEGDGNAKLKEYYKKYNVPQEDQVIPALFIGNSYLMGEKAIEKGLEALFIKAKTANVSNINENSTIEKTGAETIKPLDPSSASKKNTELVYFYLSSCGDCEKAAGFIRTLKGRYQITSEGKNIYSDIEINKFNLSKSQNIMIANQYFLYYKVPDKERKVPIVFLGNTYLSGEKAIREKLVKAIQSGSGLDTPKLGSEGGLPDISVRSLTWKSILGAFLAGSANGLNPCSMSMLLFFLSMLLMKSFNILKAGLSFIAGKFITYLLLGILLYNLLASFNVVWIQTVIKVTLLIVIVVFVILNILDFFAARSEKYDKIKLQLPTAFRRFNHKWIKKITGIENTWLLVLISFGIGVVISVGEFLCTGQIYLASIMYMLQSSMSININALILFLIYALAFVLPLVILTLVIYKGKEIFDVSEVIREKMHIIKLINIIIFILFGIFVILKF